MNLKRIKVQREKGNKSPMRKGKWKSNEKREIKVQKENGKSRCDVKKIKKS